MTWTIRLRLAATLLVTLVVVAALVVIFNQRQHTIASTSATIVAPSVTVASNYDGTVIRSYVDVGSDVTKGEKLFEVSSVSLQQDLANDVKIADSDALRVDEETGTLTYLATTDGTVTQIEAEPGSYLGATQPLAVITGESGRVVEAQYTLTPGQYGLIDRGATVELSLPDDSTVMGEVDSAVVETVEGKAVVTVRVTSEELNDRDLHLVATDGAPVSAVIQLRDEGVFAGPTDALRSFVRKVGL